MNLPETPAPDQPNVEDKPPEQPSAPAAENAAAQPADDDSGPGFFVSLALVAVALFAIRFALPHIPWKAQGFVLGGLFLLALFFRYSRRAMWKALIVAFVLSAVVVVWQDKSLPGLAKSELKQFVGKTIHVATGWGIGRQVEDILGWKSRQRAKIIEEFKAERGKVRDAARKAAFAPYLDAVDERSDVVRAKAAELTRPCKSGDRLCEVAVLNRFVATTIKYRSDPRPDRSGSDLIQSPERTLAIGAGDCDDVTVLLASLLESVGRRTVMAFTPNHVFPMVCFDATFGDYAQRTAGNIAADPGYRQFVLGEAGWPVRGQPIEWHRVGEETCYPLEPTSATKTIGFPHDNREVEAVVDPLRKSYVKFESVQRIAMP
jgi:hypothetical protein